MLTRSIRHALGKLIKLTLPGFERGPHITRYEMYRRLAEALRDWPQKQGRVLSISHSTDLARIVGISTDDVVEVNYPEASILELPLASEDFDFVVADQVLEHVEGDPFKAVDECRRVLRSGGLMIHTTCFINPKHGAPYDFWRFTPEALSLLCREFSKVIEVGGWGNRAVWLVSAIGLLNEPIPHAAWHPLNRIATANQPEWPIVTWVIAQK